jgi:hypothetical protein
MQGKQGSWRTRKFESLQKISWDGFISKDWSALLLAIFLGSIIFLALPHGAGATDVSGDILSDRTWTKAASPYIVKGNISVVTGVTLTIQPGVAVKFDGAYGLVIDGALIAQGTAAENITFTTNKPGQYWNYLDFRAGSANAVYDASGNYVSGSILQYCLVEYAGNPVSKVYGRAAVQLTNAHPFIDHCTIRHNQARGIKAGELLRTLKITNNTIIDNDATIDGGDGGSGGGIRLGQYQADPLPYGPSIIFNNTIASNKAKGTGGIDIYLSPLDHIVISKNIIRNNTSVNGAGGIDAEAYVIITENIILDNISTNNIGANSGGGAIHGQAGITNNILCGNQGGALNSYNWYAGFTVSHNAILRNTAINYSAFSFTWPGSGSSIIQFTNNLVTANKTTGPNPTATCSTWDKWQLQQTRFVLNYNNIFGNTATYDLENKTPYGAADINAENNWWGATEPTEIQGKIFDWHQDSTRGLVDYSPWENALRTDVPISPPLNLKVSYGADGFKLTWQANLEADLSGYKIYWGTTSGYPYANVRDVGQVTSYTFTDLPKGNYYFALTSYDTDYSPDTDDPATIVNENQTQGHESWFSEEQTIPKGIIPRIMLLLMD